LSGNRTSFYVCGLLWIALDDHLVVTDEYRHGPWALISAFPQQGQLLVSVRLLRFPGSVR